MKEAFSRTARFIQRKTLLAGLLALLSSVGSISVAMAAGWQRGAVTADQVMFAGVNVIAVLAAQFLPALGAHLALFKRAVCIALWSMCVAYTALGHAWYLLAAQERAGTARAASVIQTQAPLPLLGRELSAILTDKANVTEQLARFPVWTCDGACAERLRLRKAALQGRLAALDAEAQTAVARNQSRAQIEGEVRHARQDLVGAHLAASLGIPYETVTWMTALTFALILEGVGCFCWIVVLKTDEARPTVMTTAEEPNREVTGVTDDLTPVATGVTHTGLPEDLQPSYVQAARDLPDSTSSRARSFDSDVARVTDAMRDSAFDLTVTQVRQLLTCGQRHAQKVRQYIAETLPQRRGDPACRDHEYSHQSN